MSARLLLSLSVLAIDVMPCSHPRYVPPPAPPAHDKLARLDFNRRAAERYTNVFWRSDANQNNSVDPAELAVLWGYGDAKRSDLVDGRGRFTPAFEKLYEE